MYKSITTKILIIMFALFIAGGTALFAEEGGANTDVSVNQSGYSMDFVKYLAAAIAIGAATIASGLAIGKIGSAAMGAVSERPEVGGTAIILAALAEGVCLWGFLIAFFILQ